MTVAIGGGGYGGMVGKERILMFTEKEIEYLTGQRLGRLATVTPGIEVNPWVAFVVDDVAAIHPWTPRGVTIRGRADIHAQGGERLGQGFDSTLIRITPARITSWGIDAHAFGPPNSRKVGSPQ